MKINLNTWHAKFYKYAYNRRPDTDTNDGCTYFSRVSLAIAFYPFYGLGILVNKGMAKLTHTPDYSNIRNYIIAQLCLIAFLVYSSVIGHEFLHATYGIVNYTSWYNHLGLTLSVGLVLITSALSVTLGITYGIGAGIYELLHHDTSRNNNQNTGFFKSAYKAFKEKHCPIITWEKDTH